MLIEWKQIIALMLVTMSPQYHKSVVSQCQDIASVVSPLQSQWQAIVIIIIRTGMMLETIVKLL